MRLVLEQQALESEQQLVLTPPFEGRTFRPLLELGQRRVVGAAPSGADGERLLEGLAIVHERFACELLHTRALLCARNRRGNSR
jgi:hypothetical protein